VVIVSGPVDIKSAHKNVEVIKVESAQQMLEASEKEFEDADIAILTAAVADYRPSTVHDRKIKREHDEIPTIELVKNPDIAATLGRKKRDGQILVGFALETNDEESNATDKLKRKNLDKIVLNSLRNVGTCFGTDNNKVSIYNADGTHRDYDIKPKSQVAIDIIDSIVNK
jgi:phosphopantothenoylcysteine decarboxylase/phosphopantothenate--cysteine ligase